PFFSPSHLLSELKRIQDDHYDRRCRGKGRKCVNDAKREIIGLPGRCLKSIEKTCRVISLKECRMPGMGRLVPRIVRVVITLRYNGPTLRYFEFGCKIVRERPMPQIRMLVKSKRKIIFRSFIDRELACEGKSFLKTDWRL